MTDQHNIGGIKFLDRNAPKLPFDEIRQIALAIYDLGGDFKPLKSERDQNYHIQTKSGENYVLKLSNQDEDAGVIDFQLKALTHIKEQDPALPVPRVLSTKEGTFSGLAKSSDGTEHIVHVLTYLPGIILDEAKQTKTLWKNRGAFLARLDISLRGFFHPHARHQLLWDITRCTDLRPHTIHIPDAVARQNVEQVLDHMAADVLPKLKTLRHQVIHNDADVMNSLTDPRQPDIIAGLLDFGDMIYAPLILEPILAADISMIHKDNYIEFLSTLIAGYDSILPLEEEEIDLVYDLTLARYTILATIIAWRRALNPDQPAYLPEEEKPCWEAISSFMAIKRSTVRDALRKACCYPPYCPTKKENDIADDTDILLERRHRLMGAGAPLFYKHPIHVERGRGPWLYDVQGNAYIDAYNNVPVVGHCHPHVVKAVSRQTAALNLNTRYIYQNILDYAERLTTMLPDHLSACFFVNSGSEANDIAWQMSKFITDQKGALVMENAYHGITEAIEALSPYEINSKLAPHVQTLISPDPYRGPYQDKNDDLIDLYAADTDRAIADMAKSGQKPAAFMIDSSFISNGIPDVPDGYLSKVADKVRNAGGLIIADEVQAGFGRLGTDMWGCNVHGITPDFVTIGKPVGNGYPLGVVITSPEILNAYVNETELFSSFGGNPVACAAGMAVLDVIENENLMANAYKIGNFLRDGIRTLMDRHPLIGDVRGRGLIVGVELVKERETKEPAAEETDRMLDLMRDNGVLVGSEGPYGNVIKIRPSLVFREEHADILIKALDRSLESL
ncbi:MAG: aminotransferase class III-fold pyridoxal phosphate-dependent enzyme [Deltaproteobacteria bacterium]|nr:aminotransferase class III-fold pyridoxal phosphate-dependent enzyme [Deltaproteobacteria bacterium]